MSTIKPPKIFVSYSWSSPEHQEWVLELSQNLMEDGIDIVLDKWELREGSDSHSFMERMVNDESVTKIIMIIDEKYTNRANSREGGVGTESTILSNELYTAKGKNKIVAVIAEPNAEKPTFYAGRIHVDLSNQNKYAEEYEKLVRWAYDKYEYEKPKKLGTPPSFITIDDSTTALHTNTAFRIALDAIEKGKSPASGNVKSYLNKLNSELPKLSINNVEVDDLTDSFEKSLRNFQPYLLEFKKIVEAICNHSNDPKIHKHIRDFFESSLDHLNTPPNKPSRYVADLELFEFIIYQTFLNYIAILLKNEEFEPLKEIIEELIILPEHLYKRSFQTRHQNFIIFMNKNATIITNDIRKNKISPLGSLLQDLSDGIVVSFNELIDADIFLYLKSIILISGGTKIYPWRPHTAMYLNHRQEALRVFLKSEKPTYFKEVKNTLGCMDLQFIEKICPHEEDWTNHYVPKWNDNGFILNLRSLTNFEKLEIKKVSMIDII